MSRDWFYKVYWKLQSIIAPDLKYAQSIFEDTIREEGGDAIAWLDLGCGHHLLPPWRRRQEEELVGRCRTVVGIDYDLGSLRKHGTVANRVRGDITRLPFPDESFDLITANMVFEHLDNPEAQLREIARVLKKGGKLLFHTPNAFGYVAVMARLVPEFLKNGIIRVLEGREEGDVFPTYYRINTSRSVAAMAEASGLHARAVRLICSSAQFVVVPPIVFFELLWIRLLMTKPLRQWRTNIIAILEKP